MNITYQEFKLRSQSQINLFVQYCVFLYYQEMCCVFSLFSMLTNTYYINR